MFYVYEWFDVKSGEIIYVGKGTKRRYKVRKHNKLFNECIAKSECDSRIIAEFSTEEEAFLYEQEDDPHLIRTYKGCGYTCSSFG